jgi:thioredoxin reductase (NADPH)
MIVRRDVFRASKAMQERVASKENIEVLWQCEPLEVVGDESGVTGVKILDKKLADRAEAEVVNGKRGVVRIVPVWGMFLAVGHHPNSEVFKPWINMDAEGYVITEPGSPKTNVPGIFAAGDVADLHYKQAITAAAAGCKAAVEVDKFLQGE